MEELNKPESVQYPKIAEEINSMASVDQGMRKKNVKDKEYWDENVDRQNTLRMKEIIEKIGWPNTSKVGKKAAHNAWLLIQHADHDVNFQKECLDLIKSESAGEVRLDDVAYLEDRVRLKLGQPQLYGTQFNEVEGRFIPKDLEDPDDVNERRKNIGLNTLEEATKEMYEKYGMEEPKD